LTQAIEELQTEELTIEVAKLFPRQGKWTEKDYYNLPETNRIIELSGKWGAGELAHSTILAGFQVAVDSVFGGR
jgi:hypothetical protein